MGEFAQTPLLMLAASIGSSDPWVMAASSRAVTLTPYRMMSAIERRESIEQGVLLCLSDLGYHGDTVDGRSPTALSPLRSRSEPVLLLPWSLLSTIAELDVAARTSPREIPRCYAPEDWFTARHHFVDGADWGPLVLDDDVSRRADMLSKLPFTGMQHFILAARSAVNVRDVTNPSLSQDRAGASLVPR